MSGGWDRLTPEGQKFFKEIDELIAKKVFVGFQAGHAAEEDGTDIAAVAAWNELGTENIPSRPFLRMSVDENEGKINAMCAQQVKTCVTAGLRNRFLRKLALLAYLSCRRKSVTGRLHPTHRQPSKQKAPTIL